MTAEHGSNRRETTVSDVARAARVSKATAARALGDYGAVSDDVRDRVQAAAERLGYRPNALAKSMNTGKSNTIGVVIGDIENPFFARATRGISDVARAAGFDLILANSDEELEAETAAIELLLDKRVDGFIVTPASSIETRSLQTVLAAGRPMVLLDRRAEGLDAETVTADNAAGAAAATRRLLETGHERIAFISTVAHATPYVLGDDVVSSSVGDRIDGFTTALRQAGIADPASFVRLDARVLGIEQVARDVLTGPGRVTAIIASDSLVGSAVFRTIRELGLRIPDDVSLVAFDDADWTTLTTPPITVVSQPIYELGAESARRLIAQIGGTPRVPGELILAQSIVERGSVGAPPLR
ncbi:MAG TPA: LacI family DNA-binding transcriptional regulator [Plantibacter sp.]|uniref:LacI family DNA-binding transcriptional regulator n=1 Tax=unclassified Plantibacter TaxID=2624265 RepID=UPI002CACBE9D|nr:LacI family DNA-binding transcriptional regulator [Plantibacter sp.]